MTRRIVTVLGGSSAFTPALAVALAERAAELPPLELRLWGRTPRHVDAVTRFCRLVAAAGSTDHVYGGTTDLDAALDACDVVLCQVRVGGFAGRSADETMPLAHGLPGDETIGPGGLAAALRSVATVQKLGRLAARRAPGAPFVLSSNPLGILLRALAEVEGLAAFGLCELPERTLQRAAARLDLNPAQLTGDYVGSNHQGAFVAVRDAAGTDVLPAMLNRLAQRDEPGAFGVDGALMQRHGLLWLPYARLLLHRERTVAQALARPVDRGGELATLARALFDHYATATSPALPTPLRTRPMPWHEMAIVPALAALFDGRPRRLAISEPNAGHLPWLPAAAIVEKYGPQVPLARAPLAPALAIDEPRLRPLRNLVTEVDRFETLAVTAARSPSATHIEACLRALPGGLPPAIDLAALARDVRTAAHCPPQEAPA